MSRHLCDLKSLLAKLQVRYGEDDESVQQVRLELEALEGIESKHQELLWVGTARPASRYFRRGWDGSSSSSHSTQRQSP